MKAVLAGLLLLAALGCGGEGDGGEAFAVYHLEAAVGRPGVEGELRCGPPVPVCPGVPDEPPTREYRYRVVAAPALTEAEIVRASVHAGRDPETGGPVVVVGLTAHGTRAYAAVTRRAARIGGRDLAWNHVAIVVGDELVAFPEIDFDRYPDGIPAARTIRVPAVSDADARALATLLRGG